MICTGVTFTKGRIWHALTTIPSAVATADARASSMKDSTDRERGVSGSEYVGIVVYMNLEEGGIIE